MRRLLMVFLGFGVIFGFGSGFASLHHLRHHQCWHEGRWADGRGAWREAEGPGEAKAPAPAPQAVVVQPAAPAAAAPQVFVIMPQGASLVPPVVTVAAVPATPSPSGNVAPTASAP